MESTIPDELTIRPVLLRFRSNNQYLRSISQANGRWNQVKVNPCKADNPRRVGWATFWLSDGELGDFTCIANDLRTIQAVLDSYQSR